MLMDEMLQLKKEKDLMTRQSARIDAQMAELRNDVDKSSSTVRNTELKIQTLKSQVSSTSIILACKKCSQKCCYILYIVELQIFYLCGY